MQRQMRTPWQVQPQGARRWIGVWLAAALYPVVAPAQAALRGTTRDASGAPIIGAQVRVVPRGGTAPAGALSAGAVSTESGDDGRFTVSRLGPGPVAVVVRRVGFRPESLTVTMPPSGAVDTALVLQPIAPVLAAVRVVGRRDVVGHMAGFYTRQALGLGTFFTAADIERRNPQLLTDLLRQVPGMRVSSRSDPATVRNSVRARNSTCAPVVRLDGVNLSFMEFDLDSVDPRTLEALEIYRGGATVPVEFSVNRDISSSCGMIVLWTRVGTPGVRRRPAGEPSPAAQIAALLDSLQVFQASDVDTPARLDSTRLVRPVYPDDLYNDQQPGQLLAEFVVAADGTVELETFSAVTTSSPLLVPAVRRALASQRFLPAQRRGRPVAQVVQQRFDFDPDSAARRAKRR